VAVLDRLTRRGAPAPRYRIRAKTG